MNKKILIKLAIFLPMMMALASCSSMGGMQTMQTSTGQAVHKISHKKTIKHYPQKHTKQTSAPKPATVAEPKQPAQLPKKDTIITQTSEAPSKSTQIEQITIKEPIQTKTRSLPVTMPNPVVGQLWILPVHGVELKAHNYTKANERHVVKNIGRMDLMSGKYHYIQVTRWDGTHMDKAFVNARTASMLSLTGLGLLENGYIETNFGAFIIIFAGKGILVDLPANQYEMVTHKVKNNIKPRKNKKHSFHQHKHGSSKMSNFDPNDFYIVGTKVIDVVSFPHTKRVHKVSAANAKITKTKTYCRIKHGPLNTPEEMVARKYRFSLK